MVIAYLNGKRVTKEEISKHEITSERIKQIILQAIRRKEAEDREKEEKGRL